MKFPIPKLREDMMICLERRGLETSSFFKDTQEASKYLRIFTLGLHSWCSMQSPPLIFYLIWTILPYYDRVDAAGFWWYIETCFWRPFLTIYAQVANNPIFVGTLTWGHFMFGTSMMFREKVFNVIYVELPLNQTDAF